MFCSTSRSAVEIGAMDAIAMSGWRLSQDQATDVQIARSPHRGNGMEDVFAETYLVRGINAKVNTGAAKP